MSGVNTVTVEERLTVVGHKVAEKASGIGGVRETIVDLGNRMDRRFEAVELRIAQRFDTMEQRFDRRFDTMEQNMSRRFRVMVGLQLATLLAMLGAIATLAAAALGR